MQPYAVLMTTYNGSKTVAETVQSVGAAMREFGEEIPFIVYDDASQDNTVDIVKAAWPLEPHLLTVRVNPKNLGLYHNKNQAFRDLWDKFEWIFVIHQDDLACVDWIKRFHAAKISHPTENVFTIWGNYEIRSPQSEEKLNSTEGSEKVQTYRASPEALAFAIRKIYTAFSVSGCLIQTKLAKELDFFDGSFAHFGDTDFLVRGTQKGFDNLLVEKVIQLKIRSESQASRRHYLAGTDILEMARFYKKHSGLLSSKERAQYRKELALFIFKRMLRFLSMGEIHRSRLLFRPLFMLFER